jgi:hypothetical protein
MQEGEEYYITQKVQKEILANLSTAKPNMLVAPINVVSEYMYEELEGTQKLHIFFFKIILTKFLCGNSYAVSFTLHEHASTSMANLPQIGLLYRYPQPHAISRAKVEDGYLFSTTVAVETVVYIPPSVYGNVTQIEYTVNDIPDKVIASEPKSRFYKIFSKIKGLFKKLD